MFHPDHRVLSITGGSVVTRGRKNVRIPPTTIKKANDLFLLPIDSMRESPLASKRGHEECGHHGTSGLRALQTGILIADDVPITEKKRPRSVSHRKSSCQLDGIGIKAPSLERFRAWRRAGLFLRVGVLCLYTLPTCEKLIPVVQIPRSRALDSEIISAREVGARNRGCAGNNWLGYCPHSERLFATQIEKALTIMRYITKSFSAFSPSPISPYLLL